MAHSHLSSYSLFTDEPEISRSPPSGIPTRSARPTGIRTPSHISGGAPPSSASTQSFEAFERVLNAALASRDFAISNLRADLDNFRSSQGGEAAMRAELEILQNRVKTLESHQSPSDSSSVHSVVDLRVDSLARDLSVLRDSVDSLGHRLTAGLSENLRRSSIVQGAQSGRRSSALVNSRVAEVELQISSDMADSELLAIKAAVKELGDREKEIHTQIRYLETQSRKQFQEIATSLRAIAEVQNANANAGRPVEEPSMAASLADVIARVGRLEAVSSSLASQLSDHEAAQLKLQAVSAANSAATQKLSANASAVAAAVEEVHRRSIIAQAQNNRLIERPNSLPVIDDDGPSDSESSEDSDGETEEPPEALYSKINPELLKQAAASGSKIAKAFTERRFSKASIPESARLPSSQRFSQSEPSGQSPAPVPAAAPLVSAVSPDPVQRASMIAVNRKSIQPIFHQSGVPIGENAPEQQANNDNPPSPVKASPIPASFASPQPAPLTANDLSSPPLRSPEFDNPTIHHTIRPLTQSPQRSPSAYSSFTHSHYSSLSRSSRGVAPSGDAVEALNSFYEHERKSLEERYSLRMAEEREKTRERLEASIRSPMRKSPLSASNPRFSSPHGMLKDLAHHYEEELSALQAKFERSINQERSARW